MGYANVGQSISPSARYCRCGEKLTVESKTETLKLGFTDYFRCVNCLSIVKSFRNLPERIKRANKDMAKMGRPTIKVDLEMVETLARIHRTDAPLAEALGMNRSTLQRKMKEAEFRQAIERGRQQTCKTCGKPRSKYSAQQCRECYQKQQNGSNAIKPIEEKVFTSFNQAAKSIVAEIIEETEKDAEGIGITDTLKKTKDVESQHPLDPNEEKPMQAVQTLKVSETIQTETKEIQTRTVEAALIEKDTRTVTVEIPIKEYEQLLTAVRLEGYDSAQQAVLAAIEFYLEVDLETRRGDKWFELNNAVEKILKPFTPYGHFKTNRDDLLRYILELVFSEDKDSLELIYDLKVNIARFLVDDFLNQLGKKAA